MKKGDGYVLPPETENHFHLPDNSQSSVIRFLLRVSVSNFTCTQAQVVVGNPKLM